MAVYRLPRLRAAMPSSVFNCMRVVFLSAPHRPITCFGGRITPSWHDYFTDHGGPEGQPNLEEEINVEHLAWSRSQVHAALDDELARLGVAAPGKLALLGESQGACVALDAALTYPSNNLLAGVFASYGMLYSHSRLPAESKRLPVSAFIGAGDRCIGAGLSLHSFGRMLEAGYSNVHVEVAPRLPHVYEPAAGIYLHLFRRLRVRGHGRGRDTRPIRTGRACHGGGGGRARPMRTPYPFQSLYLFWG